MDYIEELIQEIVKKSEVRNKTQKELRIELLSHFLEQRRDLQIQGLSEEKIQAAIRTSFGDITFISKQISMVEKSQILKDKIITGILVSFITSAILSAAVVSHNCFKIACGFEYLIVGLFGGLITWFFFVPATFTNSFSLYFLVFQIVLIFLTYGILYFFRKKFSDPKTRIKTITIILSLAVIFQSLSIFLSYHKIFYPNLTSDELLNLLYTRAGFPLPTFEFPFSTTGGDYVPLSMWGNFYINYGIWLLVAIILYPFIPKRFKNQSSAVMVLLVVAITTLFFSLGWIVFQFD